MGILMNESFSPRRSFVSPALTYVTWWYNARFHSSPDRFVSECCIQRTKSEWPTMHAVSDLFTCIRFIFISRSCFSNRDYLTWNIPNYVTQLLSLFHSLGRTALPRTYTVNNANPLTNKIPPFLLDKWKMEDITKQGNA